MDIDRDKQAADQLKSKMTKKEKLAHTWYYYKFPIIIGIIALFFIGDFVVQKINEKATILNVTVVTAGLNLENFDKLVEKAQNDLVEDKKETEMFMTFNPDDSAAGTSVLTNQKLTVQIAAQELDVIILPKSGFELFAANGTFLDMSELTDLSKETSQQLNFVLAKGTEEDPTEKAYGIDLSNFPVLKDLYFADKEPVLAVLSNSKNHEMAAKFIEWLHKQKSI